MNKLYTETMYNKNLFIASRVLYGKYKYKKFDDDVDVILAHATHAMGKEMMKYNGTNEDYYKFAYGVAEQAIEECLQILRR